MNRRPNFSPAADVRLVALRRAGVPTVRQRLQAIADAVVAAQGLVHASLTVDRGTLPGSITQAKDLSAAALRALGQAQAEAWWLSLLPAGELEAPAPTDDQQEELLRQGIALDAELRRDAAAAAAPVARRLEAVVAGDAR